MSESAERFDAKSFLKTVTSLPGVYRMLDADGTVIYVGKARNLKKRLASYFTRQEASPKTRALVAQIRNIELTVTHTEGEALILENNLIKEFKPRYNVLLRDDKSYPYIYLSDHEFPSLGFHRGKRSGKGRYFGPFPNASAVRESLSLLQKLFPVRQCRDSYYRSRTRACLQHQIGRCTAPCVGLVERAAYLEDVRHARMFLEGRNSEVIDELGTRMEQAAGRLEFEAAARYRDQIANLRRVQERQYVSSERGDVDILAAQYKNGIGCVQVFFVRGGLNLGNKSFFPGNTGDADEAEILGAFIPQFYLSDSASGDRTIPGEILVDHEPAERELLEEVLSAQAGRKVTLTSRVRGDRARWLEMARQNAQQALASRLASRENLTLRFETLQEVFALEATAQRIECFDISHTQGEATVASCVVFDSNGAVKSDYRRFNIEGITAGDDYAAMRQAVTRRYRRLVDGEGKIPDILLIDGGRGQVHQAEQVLEELQVEGVLVVGVAKGPTRKPGMEELVLSGQTAPIILAPESPALHLIQQIRDEAHRFAITGHRQRRARARRTSVLEGIAGLGPRRRQALLRHFGGLQEIARAGVEDLCTVKGISSELAQRIYDVFHSDNG